MHQRFRVLADQVMTTTPTSGGLAMYCLGNLCGRHEYAVGVAMPRLPATFWFAGRGRRLALQAYRIGRRRLGRVRRIQLEPCFEVADPGFQLGDPLLHRAKHGCERRLGVGCNLLPEFVRNRQGIGQGDVVSPSPNSVNPRV